MDLKKEELDRIEDIVNKWFGNDKLELETTFGVGGQVDTTTFMNVLTRLKAMGYEMMSQDEKLNILTPLGVRFSLVTLGTIQQYCRDDQIEGKPYTAQIKDKAQGGDVVYDLNQYLVRFKIRREMDINRQDAQIIELLTKWSSAKKAFRLIRRYSFSGNGIQFDLSMVRSTSRNDRGGYNWVTKINQENFLDSPPVYEIEVECKHDKTANPDAKTALRNLIAGVGEVLRGVQRNSLLIRQDVNTRVTKDYEDLIKSKKFRGVNPKTLVLANMSSRREPNVPNIRDNYNVTDKADGLRTLGFCDSRGDFYLIDMGLNIYRTGLRKEACRKTLVDGEWVTKTEKNEEGIAMPVNQYLIFDIYYGIGGERVSQLPFLLQEQNKPDSGRHSHLLAWMTAWSEGTGPDTSRAVGLKPENILKVGKKEFFGIDQNTDIFIAAKACYNKKREYHTDGLIFTANRQPLPDAPNSSFNYQFKWKPAKENTIDFLVISEKDEENPRKDKISFGPKSNNSPAISYKSFRLCVYSGRDVAWDDPQSTILNELPLPGSSATARGVSRPVAFIPKEFPDVFASVCNIEAVKDDETEDYYSKCEDSNDIITDGSIVEMRYDLNASSGWRWVPIRVRFDKTERFLKGQIERTMNSEVVANDNWESIHDPITVSMITTGSEIPTEAELSEIRQEGEEDLERKYYARNANTDNLVLVDGLRRFHNDWIKERILLRSVAAHEADEPRKTLIDTTCGKAGDLHKWRNVGVDFVLGVDFAGDNITNRYDGAYARQLEMWVKRGKDSYPPMIFVNGDSSQMYRSGTAATNDADRKILRSIFGEEGGSELKYVQNVGASRLKNGADIVACMFSLHYFFETKEKFNGYLANLNSILKVGGYFIGCAFDGHEVFELLRGVQNGDSKVGKIGRDSIVWTIKKEYDNEVLPKDDSGFGLGISVNFLSIGMEHKEYLIPFELLESKMKSIGCRLLTKEECDDLGLSFSTNIFKQSYQMAEQDNRNYPMDPVVKQFSFLNRWFIFKRETLGDQGDKEDVGERPALVSVEEAQKESEALREGTLPVEASQPRPGETFGEDVVKATTVKETYLPSEIFAFAPNAPLKDTLDIKDKSAARWLSINAPFIIEDPADTSNRYPSIEHYLGAMRYKHGTSRPDLGPTIFGVLGTIAREFKQKRDAETGVGKKKLSPTKEQDLLLEEHDKVLDESRKGAIERNKGRNGRKLVFDETAFSLVKDQLLKDALRQRFEKDKRFHDIVMTARAKNKYLLFNARGMDDLSGQLKEGKIEGQNKVGKYLMEIGEEGARQVLGQTASE
jgi:predicted NAD-dependent protein-ADP-ribosyltransferase YbiA (DUF1768 family)